MPKLTMKQLARANNVAIAKSLDPREITEALQETLKLGAVMLIPEEELEALFYKVLEVHDA
jgi:hypothetical protein